MTPSKFAYANADTMRETHHPSGHRHDLTVNVETTSNFHKEGKINNKFQPSSLINDPNKRDRSAEPQRIPLSPYRGASNTKATTPMRNNLQLDLRGRNDADMFNQTQTTNFGTQKRSNFSGFLLVLSVFYRLCYAFVY